MPTPYTQSEAQDHASGSGSTPEQQPALEHDVAARVDRLEQAAFSR